MKPRTKLKSYISVVMMVYILQNKCSNTRCITTGVYKFSEKLGAGREILIDLYVNKESLEY
jgi:hypothetical protein